MRCPPEGRQGTFAGGYLPEKGWLAERGRFELPVHCCTPLFENGTISHSDTSPGSILATSPSAREAGVGGYVGTVHSRLLPGPRP